MKKSIFTIVLILMAGLSFISLSAQGNFPTGLVLDDNEYEDVSQISPIIEIDPGQKYMARKVDLRRFCPPVRHQGDISSCVGWSAGYGAMTIERAIQNGWTDKDYIAQNANSALFVYNQISGDECQGIRMPQALAMLKESGNCLARDFDFDINDCSAEASPEVMAQASEYKIEEYIRLFDLNEAPQIKVENVKKILVQKKPVVVGMMILNNFLTIGAGTESWVPGVGDDGYAGGHAMVVVGYDDDKFYKGRSDIAANKKGAFLVMNSWGKNWGQKGFIWVKYVDFAKYCKHAYAIMMRGSAPIDMQVDMASNPTTETRELTQLEGSFSFKSYTGEWFNDEPVFKEETVELNDHTYFLKNRKIGEQFQLHVKSGFKKGYIYVFSVDPNQKVNVHFPRSREYNAQYEGANESALVMRKGSVLKIPSPKTALTVNNTGTDHLIVLFSQRKIKAEYIQYLGKKLTKNSTEALSAELKSILEKHMVPFADITYTRHQMGFEVGTRSEGKIIPLVLALEAE